MDHTSESYSRLAKFWHERTLVSGRRTRDAFASSDSYAAFYTSKFLLQDTCEAVWTHMRRGFSDDPMLAYIEVWGVLQALVIQQDAIGELYHSIVGSAPTIDQSSAWLKIRDLRNRCAGHPSLKTTGKSHVRTFMGRGQNSYEDFTYEQYDSGSNEVTHPRSNLRGLIEEYDLEASALIEHSMSVLKVKLAEH